MDMLSNIHSGCTGSSHYGWWLAADANSCKMYSTSLWNTYEQEPRGSLASNAVWPDGYTTFGCPASYTNGIATWLNLTSVSGGITNGLPPGGDFVPPGVAGISYVSPGYQTSSTIFSASAASGTITAPFTLGTDTNDTSIAQTTNTSWGVANRRRQSRLSLSGPNSWHLYRRRNSQCA